jgi:hypothetical protein
LEVGFFGAHSCLRRAVGFDNERIQSKAMIIRIFVDNTMKKLSTNFLLTVSIVKVLG